MANQWSGVNVLNVPTSAATYGSKLGQFAGSALGEGLKHLAQIKLDKVRLQHLEDMGFSKEQAKYALSYDDPKMQHEILSQFGQSEQQRIQEGGQPGQKLTVAQQLGQGGGDKSLNAYRQKKLEGEEKQRVFKENTPLLKEQELRYAGYNILNKEADKAEKLLRTGKVQLGPTAQWTLSHLGAGLLNKETQEYLAVTTKMAGLAAKEMTRGNTTNLIERIAQNTKPNLVNDIETNLNLVNGIKQEAKPYLARQKVLNGLESPAYTPGLRQKFAQAEQGIVEKLPPPSQAKGKGYLNEETGMVDYSDGKAWRKVSLEEYRKLKGK